MNSINRLLTALLAISALALTACEVSTDSGPTAAGGKKQKVQKLNTKNHGLWATDCMVYPIGHSTYHIITLEIDSKTMTRNEYFYKDATCSGDITDEEKEISGDYSVTKTLSDGRKMIELRIPAGKNAWSIREFHILNKDDVLMMSPYFSSTFDNPEEVSVRYRLERIIDEEEDDDDNDTPPEKTVHIEEGIYKAVSGDTNLCDQEVKVQRDYKTNKITSIWLAYQPPCELINRPYSCNETGLCQFDGKNMQVLNETSYRWENPSSGLSATFEIQ